MKNSSSNPEPYCKPVPSVMARNHDSYCGVKALLTLCPGTKVVVQEGHFNPNMPWTMVEQYGRQVGISDGSKILLRNRVHVREFRSPVALPTVDSNPDRVTRSAATTAVSSPQPCLPHRHTSAAASFQTVASAGTPPDIVPPDPVIESALHSSPPACTRPNAQPVRCLFYDSMVTRSGQRVKSPKAQDSI